MVELTLFRPAEDDVTKDPLVWLVHGPPGTGKSHVLSAIKELFNECLGYTQGFDYEFTALQATTANDIG
eukprot:4167676-Amphidinium_carterae.1